MDLTELYLSKKRHFIIKLHWHQDFLTGCWVVNKQNNPDKNRTYTDKIWIFHRSIMSRAEFIRFLQVLEEDSTFRSLFKEAEPEEILKLADDMDLSFLMK
tara:strand:- start:198 stop:497 length:300 start_codon:yes stop_codon:yes gene_type:complete